MGRNSYGLDKHISLLKKEVDDIMKREIPSDLDYLHYRLGAFSTSGAKRVIHRSSDVNRVTSIKNLIREIDDLKEWIYLGPFDEFCIMTDWSIRLLVQHYNVSMVHMSRLSGISIDEDDACAIREKMKRIEDRGVAKYKIVPKENRGFDLARFNPSEDDSRLKVNGYFCMRAVHPDRYHPSLSGTYIKTDFYALVAQLDCPDHNLYVMFHFKLNRK